MKLPETFADDLVNVIIETPAGCRNKYVFNPDTAFFELKKVLPAGTSFPVDFGFIPYTMGEDGDPLDVLMIMEERTFPGCLVRSRIIGVLLAEQREKNGKTTRNDRFVAIPDASVEYKNLQDIDDLRPELLTGLIQLFNFYNRVEGKEFRYKGKAGPRKAVKMIKKQSV